MATRRMELLIDRIRRDTGNTDYSATNGISQTDIVEYLNDAQDYLQTAIRNVHSKAFEKETAVDTIVGQEKYALPADCLFEGGIKDIWYSTTGLTKDYFKLKLVSMSERSTFGQADPVQWIRQHDQYLLNPIPSRTIANGLRLIYIQRLPRLDVRRGKVSAVTLGASTITSLTVNVSDPTFDAGGLLANDFICIVSRDGAFKMQNIPITAVNSSTGVITVDSSFTFAAGETIAVGDYAVSGLYTTSHSSLDATVERFLVAYAEWKVMKRDSNNDSSEMSQELVEMGSTIVQNWASLDEDVDAVPILVDW